ncbi:hypothetical protein ACFVT2_42315 [Streptomyces sp. NPDC058000]|uniref:hypothetical protein n=1 Tax=Streptomyces sp. NPDC058000 TaxID=3346299 RepID=UPI0036EC0047
MLAELRDCPICWTQFQVNPQAATRHTYCSPRYKAEAARRRRREHDDANESVESEPIRPPLPAAARPTIPATSPAVMPMRRG